jgi:putative FmdB family regulatory protein
MPTYEYRCRSCHQTFTTSERISDHDATRAVCPKCRSNDVERVMSGFYAKTARKS